MMRNRAAILLLLASLTPLLSFAGEPWDNKPEQWTMKEVTRVLFDSPWSPAKHYLTLSFKKIREDPITGQRVEAPQGIYRGEQRSQWEWGKELPARPAVRWWSARTVRLAEQRLAQLKKRTPGDAPLVAQALDYFVIAVEGSEPLRILRDAEQDLKTTVYLELPNRLSLDVVDVQFVEGIAAGEDRVLFFFLRKIQGEPTITPQTLKVVFRCRATAKTPHPQLPNALDLRVTFEPRKMRAASKPDL